MTSYIALLRKEPGSDYGVDFPGFPGCVTAGRSLDEARSMAAEALDLHVAGMIQDQETIPDPSSLDEIMTDDTVRDAVVVLVDLGAPPSGPTGVNVTLPPDLVAEIDRDTRNRSGFLAEAARAKLLGTS